MPTYEYNCQKCGVFEISQRITEDALKACPTCGGPVERLISATAFHLKGGGWYKTDYASGSGNAAPSAASTEKSTSTETKSEPAKSDTPAPAASPAAPPTTSGGDS